MTSNQLFFVFGAVFHSFLAIVAGDADFSGLRFAKHPESTMAKPGDDVVLECALNVSADSIQWQLNGKALPEAVSKGRGRLDLKIAQQKEDFEKQTGTYQCIALFGASALASLPAEVSVAHIEHPVGLPTNTVDTTYTGSMFYVKCHPPVSVPPARIIFFKDGQQLSHQADAYGGFMLRNVTSKDSGRYTCSATNPITDITVKLSDTLDLHVGSPPTHDVAPALSTLSLIIYSVHLGSDITMDCPFSGWPLPHYNWTKYGGKLAQDRIIIKPGSLSIRQVKQSDMGTYLCLGTNRLGWVKRVIKLEVVESPEIDMRSETKGIDEGGDFNMTCTASGTPQPTIKWLLNGKPAEDDQSIAVDQEKLTILYVEKRHAGILQCFASNKAGTVNTMTMLHVRPKLIHDDKAVQPRQNHRGKPKKNGRKKNGNDNNKNHSKDPMIPPTRPNVTRLSSDSVILTWDVPPGKSLNITFFRVQYTELNSSNLWSTEEDDLGPHVRSAEVNNLKPGMSYRFRISAVYTNNDNMQGPKSAVFVMRKDPTSKRPISQPVIKSVTAAGTNALNVSWDFPVPPHQPIEGYFIHLRSDSVAGTFEKQMCQDGNSRSCLAKHLLPDSRYEIKMQAFNSAGISAFSETMHGRTGYKTEAEVSSAPINPDNELLDVEYVPESTSSSSHMLNLGIAFICMVFLIFLLFLGGYYCKNCQSRTVASEQDQEKEAQAYGLVNVGKSVTNGSAHHPHQIRHGHRHPARVHITSNPLDGTAVHYKAESVVEVASQNNNFSDPARQRLRTNSLDDDEDDLEGTSGSAGSSEEDASPVPSRQCV
ncbi:interference hedgehog isoform X1 [Cloeon dipterum]|uniref:interference hedgehog isoform X1 n=1 Tax=Cloeon dipterum TaxID=197152 RepID=UPI00321F9847